MTTPHLTEHASQQAIVDAALLMLRQMGLSPGDLVTAPPGPAAGTDLRRARPGGVRCRHRRLDEIARPRSGS